MTKPKKPKARKAPPSTVLRFTFAGDDPVDIPTAEAIAQQIEQAAKLKWLADTEFEWRRARGSEAEAGEARQHLIARAHEIRHRAVHQLQSIIDTAVHRLRTAQIAEQRSAQTRTAAGDPTREAFALALAAAAASGAKLTAPKVLNHWPTQSPPGLRHVQELLKEHREDPKARPPDQVR